MEDFKHHKQTVNNERIFKFLAGLNVELDEVRGRIIGRKPLPTLEDVFSEVRREESCRGVMLGKTMLSLWKNLPLLQQMLMLPAPSLNSNKNLEYGVITVINHAILGRLAGNSTESLQIGKTASIAVRPPMKWRI